MTFIFHWRYWLWQFCHCTLRSVVAKHDNLEEHGFPVDCIKCIKQYWPCIFFFIVNFGSRWGDIGNDSAQSCVYIEENRQSGSGSGSGWP